MGKLRATMLLLVGVATTALFAGCQRTSVGAAQIRIPMAAAVPLVTHRPVPPWTAQQRNNLTRQLDHAFASLIHVPRNGFVVLSQEGAPLYLRAATLPLVPASTLKVVTAATAFARLGSSYRFTTRFVASAPLHDHEVAGDVALVGGGDPVLTTDDLRRGVAELARAGLRRVRGHVIVDASAFTRPEQNPLWPADDRNEDYGAGTSAISLDEDVATLLVTPTMSGSPAQVHMALPNPRVQIHGSILTVGGGGATPQIGRQSGRNLFTLAGSILTGPEQRFFVPIGDVPDYVAGVVLALFRQHGILCDGGVALEASPFGGVMLWQHRSPPLREIAHTMLVVSDNHIAEQLLRTLAVHDGSPGSERAGIAVERAYLAEIASPTTGLHLYDGSGLAPADRIAPLTLASILAAATNQPGMPLITALPRVGLEGTVRDHTLTLARGRVRAKSGHINGVDALAGVVATRHHGHVAFAFVGNNTDDGVIEDADDRALDALARE